MAQTRQNIAQPKAEPAIITHMEERPEHAVTGAETFRGLIRRRGWSAPETSRRTGGAVSPSSVRAYLSGETVPSPRSALALAAVLDPDRTEGLLDDWGYPDLEPEPPPVEASATTAFASDALDLDPLLRALTGDGETHSLTYRGRALTPAEEVGARFLLDLTRLRGDLGAGGLTPADIDHLASALRRRG